MELPILKGKLKFKEGRSKWKNRFVYFLRSEKAAGYLLLYVLKSEEEYAKLYPSSNAGGEANGTIPRPNEVEPHDEIFGLEYGHRIDKNPNSIMLVGRSSVCFVGHSDFRRMINWSDKLQRELSDVYYHATLCEVTALGGCDGCASCCSANGRVPKTYGSISYSSDSSCASSFSASSAAPSAMSLKNNNNNSTATSNSSQGQMVANLVQAGTLHIEKSRICFVSEPMANTCKLIGTWDIKAVRHFGTTPNDYFCLEIDVADGKGLIMYTFKSHRVHEICRDVEAVLSNRLPPSLLILNATTPRQVQAQSSLEEKCKPCLPASSAVQIPPRRIVRRRRRSRDQTGTGVDAPEDSMLHGFEAGSLHERCSLRGLPRRASTTCARSDGSASCTAQPHRRHSNCHNFRPLPAASSPSRVGESSSSGLAGGGGGGGGGGGNGGGDNRSGSCSNCGGSTAAPALPERRLHGDEDTSAYTVLVPPARLSPTVVRRREGGQAGGEPQRSVSFRLSNFVSRATGGHEKRGSFLHRLIHKRRSRSDCDLGREIDSASASILSPAATPTLRVALPPRSIGVGPNSGGGGQGRAREAAPCLRSRIRPRPLPSPGVEDLRLFVGSFQTSSLQRPSKGSAPAAPGHPCRGPQRSASGTELCMRPADYHEFYPASEALRHSSASLVTGGSTTTTTSTTPLTATGAAVTAATAAAAAAAAATAPAQASGQGATDVPLSPIREDLRASASAAAPGPSSAPSGNSSFNRRRTTSSSSGVSSGGPSSVMRFPSTSSGGSTAPSPPVQLRRFRLHTQTSIEASLSSLQPLESPQEVTPGTTTDSAASAASSPDVHPSFLSSSSAPARDLPPCLDGHHASSSGHTTSSSAPSANVMSCSCSMHWSPGQRSTSDLPACASSLHHYVNLMPGGSSGGGGGGGGSSALFSARERDRDLASVHTGYVNLDLRGEINFGYPTTSSAASGSYWDGASTMPNTPASSTRASLVLAEDSRSVNFAPLDMRPSTKIDLSLGVAVPPRPLNYAHLQWLPNHRTAASFTMKCGHSGTCCANEAGENAKDDLDVDSERMPIPALCAAVCEIDLGGSKRDGYIEIDPIKTFAVNAVKAKTLEDDRMDELDAVDGGGGRAPKRNNSMKNGSTRRVPRFRFSSRKSYESTTAS